MTDRIQNLLILPRLRVQNANAISSPMTWGFPAMTAFVGFMHALERRLRRQDMEIMFDGIGVVCHDHVPQVTTAGFERAFHLTRNPIDKSGKTAAIVEEGRTHLTVSLVLAVGGQALEEPENDHQRLAREIESVALSMRLAGGSILPPRQSPMAERNRSRFVFLADADDAAMREFRKVSRSLLPGFAMVSRDSLLQEHHHRLQQLDPDCSLLDAWLDIARLNMKCHMIESDSPATEPEVKWEARRPDGGGWLVPIPVGYGALSPLYPPDSVEAARDSNTPFRFVESLYSVGEWISPHRLGSPEELLWFMENDPEHGLYRVSNDFEHLNHRQ